MCSSSLSRSIRGACPWPLVIGQAAEMQQARLCLHEPNALDPEMREVIELLCQAFRATLERDIEDRLGACCGERPRHLVVVLGRGARRPDIERYGPVAEIIEQLARHLPRIDEDRAIMLLGQFRAYDVGGVAPADDAGEELKLLEQAPLRRKGRRCRDRRRKGKMQAE